MELIVSRTGTDLGLFLPGPVLLSCGQAKVAGRKAFATAQTLAALPGGQTDHKSLVGGASDGGFQNCRQNIHEKNNVIWAEVHQSSTSLHLVPTSALN